MQKRLRHNKMSSLGNGKDIEIQRPMWVFAYGSLLWHPGFDYAEKARARVYGVHRSMCIYSKHHRGTPRKPGLVLGLDRGGSCTGMVFRVRSGSEGETLEYLRTREMVTRVYTETQCLAHLLDGGSHKIQALCFVADRDHPQYAGKIDVEHQVQIIKSAKGKSGTNRDYLLNTVDHFHEVGIEDSNLQRLSKLLRR